MVADVPALLEQAVSLSQIDAQSTLLKQSSAVMKSLKSMANSLRLWHDGFCEASPTPQYWLVPSRVASPDSSEHVARLFPLCFEFQSLDTAVPIVMCWAVAAQLHSHIVQICDLVQSKLDCHINVEYLLSPYDHTATNSEPSITPSVMDTDHPEIDAEKEGANMARAVCQSLEYFHRVEMGTYGSHATTYPCWSARQYFRLHSGYERELAWVQDVHRLEGDGMRWGLSMMTFADIPETLRGSSTSAAVSNHSKTSA